MTLNAPLGRQIVRRLAIATLLAGLVGSCLALWGYVHSNARAVETQLEAARTHYQSAIGLLERRLGREAFNLKVRLESLRYLEDLPQGKDRLLAYLIAQGGNVEFPSLRIEDARGELITSFEYANRRIPDVKFAPGQETAWAWDPIQGRLFLAHRQFIWLGKANGLLVLYKPMDNALLTQLAYPQTRLSLWLGDRVFASSEGSDGLAAATAAGGKAGTPSLSMLWSDSTGDTGPRLLIESTAPPLLSPLDLALPMLLGFVALILAIWFTLGTWGRHILKRLRDIEGALERYLEQGKIDESIERGLKAEHRREHDEIAELAALLERLIADRGTTDKTDTPQPDRH
jgi:hypothetical protein